MKKILYICTVALLFLAACDDSFDVDVDNSINEEYIWDIPKFGTGVLMKAYQAIPHTLSHYDGDFLDCATDNAVTQSTASSMAKLGAGQLTQLTNPVGNWDLGYSMIQYVNIFFKEGRLSDPTYLYHRDTAISNSFKQRLKGEVFFLRAWWTSELLRVYGGVTESGEALGVPVVTEFLDPEDNVTGTLVRPTYEQTVAQIFKDCDSAFALLPMEYNGAKGYGTAAEHDGRADKKMCLALKARIALYAASPAYQPDGISDAEKIVKWERAAKMAYAAISVGGLGGYQALTNSQMFRKELGSDQEYIFSFMRNNKEYEENNLPPSVLGKGRTNPSQNLVDAFMSADGYPITETSMYNPQEPYVNRDLRLERTVLYNGAAVDNSNRVLEVYYNADLGVPALDAPGKFYDNTRTGYYLRKWISQKPSMLYVGQKKDDFHRIPLMRRAEMYLNLAEALNNAAQDPNGTVDSCGGLTALGIISNIRQVSGGITNHQYLLDNQGDFVRFNEIILNERRIELAFEGHRYFDLRRTNSDLTEPVYGMTCIKENDLIVYTGTVAGTDASDILVDERPFDNEKYRYSPIPYTEIVENPGLVNNKGW